MCTKRARERERGSNASIWQHFEGSYRCKWSKCAPCNCTSGGSSLCRLDAVMSVADSICFSSFPFFFFLQDLISIPTQSFRILSSFLPNLPLLLFLLCQPISSGSSRNDANYRKEADVTAKHPCDGEESSRVVSPLLFPSLSWKFQPFQPHFFHIWHLHSLHFFLFFFFCAFLLLRTSHHCQRITHFGLSDVWAACFLHLLLWEFQTFFMQACIWREIKACVMALWCATNLPIWCKSKAQWSLSLGGKRLWWKGFWGGELHTVHQY